MMNILKKKFSREKSRSSPTMGDVPPTVLQEASLLAKVLNKAAPLPPDEEERIKKLIGYSVLDTNPEEAFDELAQLASEICQTPVALISLIDSNRQWFKAKVGIDAPETSRDVAFCSYTILDKNNVMVVPNALEDERFCQNENVVGGPGVRFYAGAPLVTPDGYALGTICTIDVVPRQITEHQRKALKIISHQVVSQLELSRQNRELKDTVKMLQTSEQNLRVAKDFAEMASVSSFENLFLSPAGLAAFEAFLTQEFCAENLLFWKEARAFKEQFANKGEEQAMSEAKELFETYIRRGAVKQVNLNESVVKDVEEAVKKGKVAEDLFDQARGEAFVLMKKDSYQRFLQSQQYRTLMDTVRHIGMVRLQVNSAGSV